MIKNKILCWDFVSPRYSITNRRRDSECGPHSFHQFRNED